IPLTYLKLRDCSSPAALRQAFDEANRQIHVRGQGNPDFKGMGTTGTVLVLLPQGAVVAHVGDSRAYRLRGTRLEQLTFDHSLLWEVQASGQIPADQVPLIVSKNIITRSLGPTPQVQVDLEGPFPLVVGDTFLLCSDGLSGQVTDDELGAVLSLLPPDEAAETLVHLANLRGGPDNITLVVARVTGPQVAEGASPEPPPRPRRQSAPLHPAIWVWLGVSALATLLLGLMQQWIPALAGLVSTAAAAITGVATRGITGETFGFPRGPFGKGPYVATECKPDGDLAARFGELLEELRKAALAENWNVDWHSFDRYFSRATASTARGEHEEAIRQYLRATTFLMDQLKSRRRPMEEDLLD
ncbi:MAG: PP2C family protein-serine/threonine phosphatase, partial [Planctomycetota bacterium]